MDPLNGSLTGMAVPSDGRNLLAGQVTYNIGERSARMTYLLPDDFPPHFELTEIIEYLCYHAGCMGAIHLLAEVPETHPAFELFRRANFSVYCWQNIYRFPSNAPAKSRYKALWSKAELQDEIPVRGLYQTVVPPLVQAAEPFSTDYTPRLVVRQKGEIMAFVECVAGPHGIFLKPVIHPSAENVSDLLSDLVFHFQNLGKPVYFPVRSYQSWISDTLAELGGENSPRYAQMVKHLAASVPAENGSLVRNRLETRSAEPTASIVQKMSEK